MAFPSDSARTKNWGTETLTDSDLEAQLDLLHNYNKDALNASTGHNHDGTSNQGPKITTLGLVALTTAFNMAKGNDIASATTTDIGAATGNYLDVTGTTTITGLGTVQAGTQRFVRFTGALTLTHNGTSLILPSAANITTAANDVAGFVSLGSGNWKCLWYQRYDGTSITGYTSSTAPSGATLQSVSATSSAVDSSTTALPVDNTTPGNTEGEEFSALDVTLTPSNTNNILEFELSLWLCHSSGQNMGITILQGTSVICAGFVTSNASFLQNQAVIKFRKTAGTTSSTTWHIRYGPSSSGTAYANSDPGNPGTGLFNGLFYSTFIVKEIKA